MASSRKYPLAYNVSTYGANIAFDYNEGEMPNWESDTDIDLVTATSGEGLRCTDDQASFDDRCLFAGATANSSYFRFIEPASGNGHDGTPNNGFYIDYTTDTDCFVFQESYSRVYDIIAAQTINSAGQRVLFRSNALGYVVGVIVHHTTNAGAGGNFGIAATDDMGIINCLVQDCDFWGVYLNVGAGEVAFIYNLTVINNANGTLGAGVGTTTAINVISENTANNFGGTWDTKTTCLDAPGLTYVDAANDDFHLAAGDAAAIDQGTDLSADGTFPFDDDIDKTTRPLGADWDIGFDEYMAAAIIMLMGDRLGGDCNPMRG